MGHRQVIMTKERGGFGFTVSGAGPVLVQSVKSGSAAAKAGVRQGDHIVKVNGVLVSGLNHSDVEKLMSSLSYVSLTLFDRSKLATVHMFTTGNSLKKLCPNNGAVNCVTQKAADGSSPGKQLHWAARRNELIQQMLTEEQKQLEILRNQKAEANSSDCDRLYLITKAERRICNLENQLKDSVASSVDSVDQTIERMLEGNGSIKQCEAQQNSTAQDDIDAHTKLGMVTLLSPDAPLQPFEILPDVEDDVTGETTTDDVFTSFTKLTGRLGHLAVFLHYLLSNSEPGYVLFHLVTDILISISFMKQWPLWAYEIYSSFLATTAPCKLSVDSEIVEEIQMVFRESQKPNNEQFARCFDRARDAVMATINEQLSDFRSKRVLGLGNVFGESMLVGLAEGDSAAEAKIFDALISQHVPFCFDGTSEYRDLPRRSKVVVSSLASLFKHYNVRCSNATAEKLLEKCPTYVSKEKSRFAYQLLPKSNRRVKNHCFVVIPVDHVIFCHQCHELLWGIKATGFLCTKCNIVLHKRCISFLRNECNSICTADRSSQVKLTKSRNDGKLPLEERRNEDVSIDRLRKVEKECHTAQSSPECPSLRGAVADPLLSAGLPMDNSTYSLNRSRSMTIKKDYLVIPTSAAESVSGTQSSQDRQKGPMVKRVESLSDYPTIDSPYLSDESESPLVYSTNLGQYDSLPYDSDFEVETETPPLEEVLQMDLIESLETEERKRLEVLYELFHTERTHVRNLKILYRLFYLRFLEYNVVPSSLLKLMFPNLEVILEIHSEMKDAMRALMAQDKLLREVGRLCLSMFTGESGERLKNSASIFCQHMQRALEMLKNQINKDPKLREFLLVIEGLPICRKLQLRDMLPMEMQRLTKYPLLLESVAKYSQGNVEEAALIKKSLAAARAIVDAVNTAKRICENHLRLEQLQRQLDVGQFVKVAHPIVEEFRQLDITTYGLVHEGPLDWRFSKNKVIPLHAILLDDILLLLTKSSDGKSLVLRFHNANVSKDETKWTHCPLLKLNSLIAKDVATDRKAFFLVSTSPYGPQIYELAANSYSEKKSWLSYITDQIEACRKRNQINVSVLPTKEDESKAIDSPCPSIARKFHERVRVTCEPRLISPSEINVLQPTVFQHARPILNPLEQLKREDECVIKALKEKLRIISNYYGNNKDQICTGASAENRTCREARELVICAVKHTNRLLEAINDHTRLAGYTDHKTQMAEVSQAPASIPSVPCTQLTQIAAAQMECLTGLMNSLQIMGEDLQRVQRELHQLKLSPERLLACQLMCEKAVDTSEDNISSVGESISPSSSNTNAASIQSTVHESGTITQSGEPASRGNSQLSECVADTSAV